MLIIERQQRVLDIVRQRRSAQLEELARELEVSMSTIRRDLEALEARGQVQRTHGGAIYTGEATASVSGQASYAALTERMKVQVDAKRAIGRYAASLVQPQMTVLLDGGSTVVYAAQYITARPIQVVTNSLTVAGLFVDDDQVELVIIGGLHYPRTAVTVGPLAVGALAELHADLLFFSLAGIYGQEAFNLNLSMAEVEQAMMRQAVRSVLLMDSSKFGRKSLARVCGLNEVDQIVSDGAIDATWRETLGSRLVIAPSSNG